MEQLELPTKSITDITEVLYAMAYLEISTRSKSGSLCGNLIQLSKYRSANTGRNEGYYITIGPPLLPHQTFQEQKNGENGLLIPLLADPPLVGAKPFHGGQYLLQMEIVGEFSKKSVELSRTGAIQITDMRWEELGQSCGLTSDITRRVKARWIQDGDSNENQLLVRIDSDFYCLGPAHNKALQFLQKQGELRIFKSKCAKARQNRKKQKNSK